MKGRWGGCGGVSGSGVCIFYILEIGEIWKVGSVSGVDFEWVKIDNQVLNYDGMFRGVLV